MCLSQRSGIFRRTSQPTGIDRIPQPIYAFRMATERARRQCGERIEQLAESSLDSESLRREAIAELKLAIGFERYCVPLADPETEVVYAGVAETDHIQELPRLLFHDASLGEPNNGTALARGRVRAGRLSGVTHGELARSRRWSESLERFGTGDELDDFALARCEAVGAADDAEDFSYPGGMDRDGKGAWHSLHAGGLDHRPVTVRGADPDAGGGAGLGPRLSRSQRAVRSLPRPVMGHRRHMGFVLG